MIDDPIVDEVRKHRQAILESFGWDFDKMSQDVMKRQYESGHKIVKINKKTPDVDSSQAKSQAIRLKA